MGCFTATHENLIFRNDSANRNDNCDDIEFKVPIKTLLITPDHVLSQNSNGINSTCSLVMT